MAALQGQVSLGSTALAAATAKTAFRVKAPANQRVKVLGYGFYFDGTSNAAAPVQLQIGRITADGTFTAGTITPDEEELSETFQTSVGTNATAEPTYFSVHSAVARLAERGATVHLMKYLDPDAPEEDQITDAEVQISGKYDDNPTGG